MIWAGRGVFFGLASGFLVFVSLDLPLLPLPCPWLVGTVPVLVAVGSRLRAADATVGLPKDLLSVPIRGSLVGD